MKRTKNGNRDRVFMSHKGKRIWFTRTPNGGTLYMVEKGNGTDEYFTDWKDAMNWIDAKKQEGKGWQ